MNPRCPHKDAFGKQCSGTLYRQHSGTRNMLVCSENKRHRYRVGSVLNQPEAKEEA